MCLILEKKYQVFVSSTYTDLIEERKKVLEFLLMADCIPAGMEAFVATDDEQFNVIKKVIDLCDYYVLIIGSRYGSINEKTGLSYTEMEYEYAIANNIPVLVFALDDSKMKDCSEDPIKRGKLAEFKKKALNNRLASVWTDIGDLSGKVAISIMTAKQQINRPGWVRDGEYDPVGLLKQIADLQKQNEKLKRKLQEISDNEEKKENMELPFYGYEVILNYTENHLIFTSSTIIHEKQIKTTLDELFKFVSLRLTGIHEAADFVEALNTFQSGYSVDTQQALVVKNQFIQLGLMKQYIDSIDREMIKLTNKGMRLMNKLNALK